jgi:WD40 repeat protein
MKKIQIIFVYWVILFSLASCFTEPQPHDDIIDKSEILQTSTNLNEIKDDTDDATPESKGINLGIKTGRALNLVFNSDSSKFAVTTTKGGIWIQDLFDEDDHSYTRFIIEVNESDVTYQDQLNLSWETLNSLYWVPNSMVFLAKTEYTYVLLDTEESEVIQGPTSIDIDDARWTTKGIIVADIMFFGDLVIQLCDKNSFELEEDIYRVVEEEPRGGDLLLSPDANKIIYMNDVIDLNSKSLVAYLDNFCGTKTLNRFNWSPDSRYIYSICSGPDDFYQPCFWLYNVTKDYESKDLTQIIYKNYQYNPEDDLNYFGEFSPFSDMFALVQTKMENDFQKNRSSIECNIRTYETDNFSIIQNVSYKEAGELWKVGYINDVVWSNDGKYLAIVSDGVKIFDVNSGNEVFNLPYQYQN